MSSRFILNMKKIAFFRRRFHPNYYFWPVLTIFLAALVFPFFAGIYPIVRFSQERIDIHVFPNHVVVNGFYVYKNPFPFPVVQGFSIPFPIDKYHPMPIDISVKQYSPTERSIPAPFVLGEHRFELRFRSKEELLVQVRYKQHAPKRNACYLLTTTKPWRRPLTRGVYKLIPEGVIITNSNYPVQPDGTAVSQFEMTNFMPEHDWLFFWEV